ncbi:MAG: transposase [Deltaproteobacteria bacterium]|nr:transposase [Deltaproteobacteria bacterium]
MKMRPRSEQPEQLSLDLWPRTWGGKRAGAGRKKSSTSDAPHRARPRVRKYDVQHVVLRTCKDVPRLRRGKTYQAIARALRRTPSDPTFRICHTSIQRNHLHFLIEANDAAALSHGMRSLAIMAARAINKILGRNGRVFAYRYHATAISSPRQMRNALSYVLNNWRRHDEDESCEAAHRAALDPYSTALSFRGWREGVFAIPAGCERLAGYEPLPAAAPETWLLRVGWERHGPISAFDVPGRL